MRKVDCPVVADCLIVKSPAAANRVKGTVRCGGILDDLYQLGQALQGKLSSNGQVPQTLKAIFDEVAPRVSAEVRQMRDKETDPQRKSRLRQTPVLTAIPALARTVLALP